MKSNDFRVGNLVTDNGFVMEIKAVGFDYLYADFEGNEGDLWEFDFKDNKPELMPLTEEWLLKFGFEKDDVFDKIIKYLPIYDLCMDKLSFRVNEGFICYESIKYRTLLKHILFVHQLQNLYWCLTNEELEYKP